MNRFKNVKKYFYLLGMLFIFVLFRYISISTPLAGDDWGYALNGTQNNLIDITIYFYNNWSGRIFSELYGFIIAPRKWLWNILNPLLFTSIFYLIYKLSEVKKNYVLSTLLIVFAMLSVNNNVRMEVYSWVMGTTYMIPLFLSLLYFFVTFKMFQGFKYKQIIIVVSNLCLFIIGLMMENIAIAMIIGVTCILIYSYINKKEYFKNILVNLIISVLSFVILRLSPGANYRLLRDSAEWAALTIYQKFEVGYPNFIEITFLNNKYLILLLSLSLIGLIVFNKNDNKIIKLSLIILNVLGIIITLLSNSYLSLYFSQNSFLMKSFWLVYVIATIYTVYIFIENPEKKLKILLFLIVGGSSALAMIFSPIYGYRSSVYVIYYLIIVIVLIINTYLKNSYLNIACFVIFTLLINNKYSYYKDTYALVNDLYRERLDVIKYYQDHPEDEDAYFKRFPNNTIHGIDIDPGDTYHFETFKEYFNLEQSVDSIYFYVED